MPATLASRLAVSGSVDLSETTTEITTDAVPNDGADRVALQLTVPLSFAEILGLLAFAPSAFLTYEAMQGPMADAEVRYALSYALMTHDLFDIRNWAQMAMACYEGRAVGVIAEFVRFVAPIVTRVFGLSAPLAS